VEGKLARLDGKCQADLLQQICCGRSVRAPLVPELIAVWILSPLALFAPGRQDEFRIWVAFFLPFDRRGYFSPPALSPLANQLSRSIRSQEYWKPSVGFTKADINTSDLT
jgi:hypothetical protein